MIAAIYAKSTEQTRGGDSRGRNRRVRFLVRESGPLQLSASPNR
jgi:hypothetical protein